jgi:hypothetical protein
MRTRSELPRAQLRAALARRAALSAPVLAQELGVSLPTVHRMLQEIAGEVVVSGKARRCRYALRQAVRGSLAELPLYEVDANGRAESVGQLCMVRPQGSCMRMTALAAQGWPLPEDSLDGWWGGLPYPLYDMQPQGFMGRQLARACHRMLGVSDNPRDWGDEDLVHVLNHAGSELAGSLILGQPAFEHWQASKLAPPVPLPARHLGRAYAELAERALSTGVPGSSAGGEFPKFTALREGPVGTAGGQAGAGTPHVLVKFSGADSSATVQRWSDLLVCEHLALQCLATLQGVQAATSRILQHAGRTFLEVERFDRHGLYGRSPVVSLATLDAAFLGAGATDWTHLAQRLHLLLGLAPAEVQRVQGLWWFGRLIANSDMHTGNLSFRLRGAMTVAPAYDMLPMLYAPLPGGELPARQFEVALPVPEQRSAWEAAGGAALLFWQQAAVDVRISAAFRAVCASNAQRLLAVAQRL